jgi:hypothetical protein
MFHTPVQHAVQAEAVHHSTLRALGAKVDQLGAINAQLAKLEAQANELKAALKASGLSRIEGQHYAAAVIERDTARLDTAKVKQFLTATEIAKCTVIGHSVAVSLYDL